MRSYIPQQLVNIVLFTFTLLFLAGCGGSGNSSKGDSDSETDSGSVTGSFAITGAILAEDHSNVDLDVLLNVTSEAGLNNSFAGAQIIESPAILGGYLSGTNGFYTRTGNFFARDAADVYAVNLVEGQEIFLNVYYADTGIGGEGCEFTLLGCGQDDIRVRFRLFALDDTSIALDTLIISEETSDSIIIPATGSYYLHLDSQASLATDPVLYTLNVSQNITGTNFEAQQSSINPNGNFVPGEVLVQFKENTLNEQPQDAAFGASAVVQGYSSASVTLHDMESLGGGMMHAKLDLGQTSDLPSGVSFSATQTGELSAAKWQTMEAINKLRLDPNVEFAEPNYIRQANSVSVDDSEFARQWNLSLINAPSAWTASTGEDTVIAVIDSGIAGSHEDLSDNLLRRSGGEIEGFDFVSDEVSASDGDGYDADPEDIAGNFHGSHVAGIAAAVANNSRGIAGVAYNAKIMPLRVLGVDGFGTDSDIVQAIRYAAGLSSGASRTAETPADIINLSLGSPETSAILQSAIAAAISENVIVIAATGNDGSSSPDYFPAGYTNVIGVGSVSQDRRRSSFSNFGVNVDVVAPGGAGVSDTNNDGFQDRILSTVSANNYAEYQGTSMAAPHVAGVAALMKSVNAGVNSITFNQAINSGDITDDLGDTNQFGSGLINAAKALEWAGQDIPASLNVFPPSLSFTGSDASTILTLSNPGVGDVEITSITALVENSDDFESSWLSVTPSDVDADGLGTYNVEVNRFGLAPGSSYLGDINIGYRVNGGDIQLDQVSVFLSINSGSTSPRVGELFVSLFRLSDLEEAEETDAEFVEVFRVVNANYSEGAYRYAITDVPPGEYLLEASTNNDNDGFINDAGEAVGSFPLFGEPSIITITDSNLVSVNFGVSYRTLFGGDFGSDSTEAKTPTPRRLPSSVQNVSDDTPLRAN